MVKRDALLELRFENLPAAAVVSCCARLKELAPGLLGAAGLAYDGVEAFGTCKRLALLASGVSSAGGRDRAAAKSLAAVFPRLAASLSSGPGMSWDDSGLLFPRPLRGLLALYGDGPVAFSLGGLKSGRVTSGLDALGARRVSVTCAEKYFAELARANVVVKQDERLASMRRELAALSKRMKLVVEPDEELLQAHLYLAECPVWVLSGFSQELLSLPRETLRRAMKELLFFPVTDQKGAPQPYLAGLRDGVSRGQRNVEEGFRHALEDSLRARLACRG